MEENATVFYKNVLDNMSDGVMTLSLNGRIIMFNPAASAILGLSPEEVIDKTFAEIFIMEMEDNDEFNQTVLDAVYQAAVGQNATASFRRRDNSAVTLSVTSSYLRSAEGESEAPAGVIVVFNDITEIVTLQDAEKELNRQLRDAYRDLEESNKTLNAALRKVQVVRIVVTLCVVVLFVGVGLYSWNGGIVKKQALSLMEGQGTPPAGRLGAYKVEPRSLSSHISLAGTIEPLSEINVISPFQGKIKERYFEYGSFVEKGAPLLVMDTSEMEIKLREARSSYIKAKGEYEARKAWNSGTEVLRARRAFASAENKLKESKLLYEKGIVPRNEYETARDQQVNQREELETVLKKGSKENVRIVQFEYENAKSRLDQLELQMAQAVVRAPVGGIVIQPTGKGEEKSKVVERGVSVSQGDLLLSIGDLDGLTVKTTVDEVDIGKIKMGQKVTVTGDAFLSIPLQGTVTHMSSQAKRSSTGAGVPMFDLQVTIHSLTPEQRKVVKVGMSANLQVCVYDNPKALLIPFGAVRTKGSAHVVVVRDQKTGEPREREVKTGITTIDAVEITEGLNAGDEVMVETGPAGAFGSSAAPTGRQRIPGPGE